MYRIYQAKEETPVYPYEERLLQKKTEETEIKPESKIAGEESGFLRNGSADDWILLGLLLVLLYEGCDDWLLILALVALLIFK